jgi:phospholipid/cholesterol/gamma-HCH transport system substrate-binding protein
LWGAGTQDSHLASPPRITPDRLNDRRTDAAHEGHDGGSRLSRAAALVFVVAAVAVVALILFGTQDGYRVKAVFQNGGQLVKGNQVHVGGRAVGSITGIKVTDDGRAEVEMELEEFDPLHEGTSAVIRAPSLSGIANRYVSLQLGPNDNEEIGDGGYIQTERAQAPVDLDQLFNTLDPATRRGLQQIVQGSATQLQEEGGRSKARQASQSLRYLNPALSTTSELTRELVRDRAVFEAFLRDTSRTVGAIAERRDDLAQLIGNANATTRAIGDENVALDRALVALPGTLRKANTTFVNLRSTLDDLDVLVEESKPASRDLARFFRELRPLVRESRPTIHDLRLAIARRGPNNDLTDLTRKQPALTRLAGPIFENNRAFLIFFQPVVDYIRGYTPDLAGWLTKFGQGAANYDANGHFARIQPLFNPFSLSNPAAGPVLEAAPPARRNNFLETQQSEKCPGGAAQYPPDGSAPFRGDPSQSQIECDPESEPPGP